MQRFNIQWTVKALVKNMEKGTINFDNAVQRSLVWDNGRKSLLIHSMVYGYAIPAMYFTAERDENGNVSTYDSLDGKQRSNSISEFLHDEFHLSADTPKVFNDEGEEEDISGLTFSQLPDLAQDKIKDYSLTIYYYDGMTDSEVKDFFRRLNNGKPLSAVELTRVNTPSLPAFQQLAKHEAIQSIMTDAGKKRFTDENIAMQIYNMSMEDSPDFSTKAFREWARNIIVSDEAIERIKNGLDALHTFIQSLDAKEDKKIFKTIKSRSHFVAASYFCSMMVLGGKADMINSTLKAFFSGNPSTSDAYNKTVGSGSAKPSAVQARKKAMQDLADSI